MKYIIKTIAFYNMPYSNLKQYDMNKHITNEQERDFMKNLIKNLKMFLFKSTNLDNASGITLIALVITIIVLLILAGVTIATLMGDNGILTKAQQAKTETEEAKEDELRKLTALEASTNLENHPYTDKNGDVAPIPAGFAVSQVQGENIIDDGLVVIDSYGNEFVWVPVNDISDFKTYAGYSSGNLQSVNCEEPYSNGYENEQVEYDAMKNSVTKNNGFYVGRYEAGTTASSGTGIRGEVVSKKGANVYNNIKWGNSMTDETGGAVEVARGMYNEEKGDSVTSTLIYGVQWDAIMRWMQDVPNLTGGKYVQDSTGMGWYSDNYASGNPNHQTGIDVGEGKNKVKNIYDLAGNVSEWTMESYDTFNRVSRGGFYDHSGSDDPASRRDLSYPSNGISYFGFRVTLYL